MVGDEGCDVGGVMRVQPRIGVGGGFLSLVLGVSEQVGFWVSMLRAAMYTE